jgi:hypothetical protein
VQLRWIKYYPRWKNGFKRTKDETGLNPRFHPFYFWLKIVKNVNIITFVM